MTDYLSTLLARSQPGGGLVRPRTAALFEPRGPAGPSLPPEVEETASASETGAPETRPMAARQDEPRPEPPAPAEAPAGRLRPGPVLPEPARSEARSPASPRPGALQPRPEPARQPAPPEAEATRTVRPAVAPAKPAKPAPPAPPRVEIRAMERVVERSEQQVIVERTIVAPAAPPPTRRADPVEPEGDEAQPARRAAPDRPLGAALVVRPRVAPARPSEPPARAGREASMPAAAPAEPAVQVTIGRIEVRAESAPASVPAGRRGKGNGRGAVMSLDEYLKLRSNGG